MYIDTTQFKWSILAVFRVFTLIMPIVLGSASYGQMSLRSAMGNGVLELDPTTDPITAPLIDSGDYNHDGFKDFLFGYGWPDKQISVALGQGLDRFDVLGPIVPAQSYRSLACGDLDGDGVVEIVLREIGTDEITIISTDTGAEVTEIVPSIDYAENDFGFRSFTATVVGDDLDGDGASDFVFNTTNQRLFVRWSSRAQGSRYEEILIPELADQSAVYPLEDYDGDGDIDILIFDESSARFILVEGTGTSTMGIYRVLDGTYPRIVVGNEPLFGQFDDDGAVDLVEYDSLLNTMTIITNFVNLNAAAVDISAPFRMFPVGIAGDLDGSGFTDLIVNRDGEVASGADVTFLGALYVDPLVRDLVFEPMIVPHSGSGVNVDGTGLIYVTIPSVEGMDVDGDDDTDLIWFGGPFGDGVRVSLNRPGIVGAPRFGASYTAGRAGPRHVLAVDLDGDSLDEVIVTGARLGRVYDLIEGTNRPVFASAGAFMSAVGELKGDGTRHVVIVGNSSQIKLYPVLADGSLGDRQIFENPDGDQYISVVISDFDLDGRDDLAASSIDTGVIHFLRWVDGAGAGAVLELWARIDDPQITRVVKPAIIDFNHDGNPDLAIGDRNNKLIVFYANNGNGTFTRSHDIPSLTGYWLVGADVDLDGVEDIVGVHQISRLISIDFLGLGGQVEERVELIGSNELVEVVAEDFTGDSLLDLAVVGSGGTGGYPVVFEQVSPRVFKMLSRLQSWGAAGIAVSDINGDGGKDLVTVSDSDRSVMVHWGSPTICPADFTGDGFLNFYDVSVFLELSPDYNNDGVFDFLDVSAFLTDLGAGCP